MLSGDDVPAERFIVVGQKVFMLLLLLCVVDVVDESAVSIRTIMRRRGRRRIGILDIIQHRGLLWLYATLARQF